MFILLITQWTGCGVREVNSGTEEIALKLHDHLLVEFTNQ